MLHMNRESPSNTISALESLTQRIQFAKETLHGSHQNKESMAAAELQAIITQMESMIQFQMDPSEVSISTSASTSVSASHLTELLRNASKRSSLGAMKDVADYVEPLYETFFCPLTKKIMEDPVTIQSGVTFERQAILQWVERGGDEATCPVTRRRLSSKEVYRNMALKAIIEEWRERNERAKIKVIQAALGLASSEGMVMEALKDLEGICKGKVEKRREVRSKGIVPLVVKFLEYKDSMVRHLALEILHLLAEDDEGKELIGKTTAISSAVRMISSRFQPVKHAALLLLAELSGSQVLSEKIGSITGGILMLIKTKYDRSQDAFASEAANLILQNLAVSSHSIKTMAENGFLEPLLDNLIKGSDNMKVEMASCLAEIVIGQDEEDTFIAKKASPTLIKMARSGNGSIRKAAFQALVPISSVHQNAKMLTEAGISQTIVEEMFTRNAYLESSSALRESAEILANLLESGFDFQKLKVTSQGHSMDSDYVVSNIIYMLTNSNVDELSLSLIRIISCLTRWSMPNIVSTIRDSEEASYALAEFINNPDEKLAITAIKLLIKLAPRMGQILIERLCKIHGQPQGLVQRPTDLTQITERQVLSVKLLATLPHENIQLNLALINGNNTVETAIQTIKHIQESGNRQRTRYGSLYLEGLVGILVRFTATLYEPQMLHLAINNDFTTIFKDLILEAQNVQVKKLAAAGLEKLSVQSTKLSKSPKVERRSSTNSFHSPRFFAPRASGKGKILICPVHRGVCSAQNTFCLIVSQAADALLLCLDQQNTEVLEAVILALSTLLDDRVDLEKSVGVLYEMGVTEKLMKLVKEYTEEGLLQKVFWMIERLLRKEEVVTVALQDRKFVTSLLNSFYHGEEKTKQIVEKILTHLRIMPESTITFS